MFRLFVSAHLCIVLLALLARPRAHAVEIAVLEPPKEVPRFGVFEAEVRNVRPAAGRPFVDVRITGTFTRPDGKETTVQGFCDSPTGLSYKIRFCPPMLGVHTFDIRYQGPDGAVQKTGQFKCIESDRLGFVRVDREHPYHFICDDGTRPFIFSKTAWCIGGVERAAWIDFITGAARNGLNCIRFGLETDYFHGEAGIQDVWPWAGTRAKPQWDAFDPQQWRAIEAVIRYAADKKVFVEPVFFCSARRDRDPHPILDPQMELYWQYAINRLSCFTNIVCWELFNEYDENKEYQQYMAEYIRKHDPYGHPIATSFGGTTMDAAWGDAAWLDIAVNHSCTSSDPRQHSLREYYRTVARAIRRYQKPAWADETGREKHGNTDGVHRRKQYWIWNMAGCYTNYHTAAGCDKLGAATHPAGPGEVFCAHIAPFWHSTHWWELEPADERIVSAPAVDVAMCLASGNEAVVYLALERSGAKSSGGELSIKLPAGTFAGRCYNPSVGNYYSSRWNLTSDGNAPVTVTVPPFADDIVVQFGAR